MSALPHSSKVAARPSSATVEGLGARQLRRRLLAASAVLVPLGAPIPAPTVARPPLASTSTVGLGSERRLLGRCSAAGFAEKEHTYCLRAAALSASTPHLAECRSVRAERKSPQGAGEVASRWDDEEHCAGFADGPSRAGWSLSGALATRTKEATASSEGE